ncbi:MAG: PTS sugar transporter subunit IIA [Candidatus Izemoplasmataceae bacterium]
MKITELINKNLITLDLRSKDKASVIEELASIMNGDQRLSDLESFIEAIKAREAQGSTGVGFGVAIPHAKSQSVAKPGLVFGRADTPINYESHEEDEADLFFMIAAPEGENNLHLQTLAKLSRKLIDEDFREQLRQAKSKEDVLSALSEIDGKED